MNSKKGRKPQTTKIQKSFSHEDLLQALYYIEDVLSRAAIPFFTIKDTAESIMSQSDLKGEAIYIGVRSTDWYSSGLGILEVVADAKETKKKRVEYEYNGVPIYVHIYQNHSCIESTDPIPYAYEYFYVPNPYDQFKQIYL